MNVSAPLSRTAIASSMLPVEAGPAIEWVVSEGLTGYEKAVAEMERVVADIATGGRERIWLVEHPPLYTAGTSANDTDLVEAGRFPVHRTGRGGEYTYHGPGQRVAYVMLDLNRRSPDLRAYVAALEGWIIATLDAFNVRGERRDDRVGVWVQRPDRGTEDKIAAIGIRVRKWVTFHGIAINVEPDLTHYSGIVPCGIAEHGVTSLVDLGLPVTMDDLDLAMKQAAPAIFGLIE